MKIAEIKTALTGGAATALDSIDGALLLDGDVALAFVANVLYIYTLDDDSGAAESSPDIIAPDTNPGNKRWIMQEVANISSYDALVYKGVIAVLATFPAANKGDLYKITAAGAIGGTGPAVQIGDVVICNTDATGAGNYAAVGTKWDIVQTNIEFSSDAETIAGTEAGKVVTPANITAKLVTTVADPGLDTKIPTEQAVREGLNEKPSHSLATAINDFLVASGVGAWVKKTLAETRTILGLDGATTEIAVGGGANTPPVWTTATGSGAPVRATSPTLAGTPLAPTPAVNTNTTQIATTEFIQTKIGVYDIHEETEFPETQVFDAVTISGGTIAGITDLAIADGGTAASDAATAFGNLKQNASTSATGVSQLATDAETIAGTSTSKVITPANLAAKIGIYDIHEETETPGTQIFDAPIMGSGVNYTTFDSTGHQTMLGDARPWRDELVDAISIKNTGAAGIVEDAGEGTLSFAHAAEITDYMYCNIQLNHDRDLASKIYPHIHWFAAEEAVVPNFMVQYRWQVQNATKVTPWTDYKCNTMLTTAPGAGVTKHAICGSTVGISPPGGAALSDIIQFRIIRDHSDANTAHFFGGNDPYTAAASVLAFDVHFQINSLGSTDELTK